MALPALGETYWAARGLGAWMQAGGGEPARLAVSRVADWADATLSLGEPHVLLVSPMLARVARLATTCASSRCYGDLAGCALLLQGKAEAWIEAGVQIWDLGPLKILVEEAGGRFTDLSGKATVASGACVASNGLVHDHVLAALRGTRARRRSPSPLRSGGEGRGEGKRSRAASRRRRS
jgi:histidinol-phosphatase